MKIIKRFLELLYPKDISCIFCYNDVFDNDKHLTCSDCCKSLPFITGKICNRCGTVLTSMANYCDRCQTTSHKFIKARAVFCYKNQVVKVIRNLKFHNAKYVAKPLARYMADLYKKEFDCDIIVPVPMFAENYKKRGYNQAELLAKYLGEFVNVQVNTTDLIKIVKTKSQVNLDYKQRQENLKDAFKVTNKNAFKNKKVLIVDDLFTTGATIDNCAEALLKVGATKIYAITVAHTMLNS